MNKGQTPSKTTARIIDLYEGGPKHVKAMTIEELQASEPFQSWTETELTAMIDTVRTFTEIVFSAWSREGQDSEQKPTIIPLHHQQRKAA